MSALVVLKFDIHRAESAVSMTDLEQFVVDRIVTFAALGGLAFMALVGWLLAFDVASMTSLIADAIKNDVISALIVGGAITKGVVVGGAIGMASLLWTPRGLE